MNDTQKQHLADLIKAIADRTSVKYAKGARENDGNLLDMPVEELLDNAIDEAIDQLVYLLTLKGKI